ncbi:MAG: pyruvate dehydrogenase (acetyl-transferring) E1 component subunit alpha [Dehalococcoidia bacterium]|jgi:pyruvate dehydrogenase E1 component alpha subunit
MTTVKAPTKEQAGSPEEFVELLRQMMLIRRFEEKSAEMYARGRIAGFLHLYIGQEATGVGAIAAVSSDDYVVSHYRDHGQALARGLDPKAVMAELFGRVTGVSKGRGGSMHLFDVSRHFMGGYAIVGGHLPVACGLAFASKHLKTDRIVLCFFGDGAVNQGEFHESLNLAAVWSLPVVFLCENNFYGMGTQISRVSAESEVYRRACAYNMAAEKVDGMDVLAVRDLVRKAAQHAREGKGPYFVESVTYRFRGHSMADPEFYRTKEEVQQWRARDPIVLFEQRLREWGLIDDDAIKRLQDEIEAAVNDAAQFAEESPSPDPSTLYDNVYKEQGDA